METVNIVQNLVKSGSTPSTGPSKPAAAAKAPVQTVDSGAVRAQAGKVLAENAGSGQPVQNGNILPLVSDNSQDAQAAQQQEASREQVEETVTELNKLVQNVQRAIEFTVDDATGRSVIVVTDKDTGEQIRQIPSEEILAIAEHIGDILESQEETGPGLLMNQKV